MNEGESDFVAERVIAPELVDSNVVVLVQPARNLDHLCRHVQMKCTAKLPEVGPLGQRLEVVDRFSGFDFDDGFEPPSPLEGVHDQVWIARGDARADGGVLLVAGIGAHVVLAAQLGLKQANDAIVFQLLANRSHEDRTHQRLRTS